MSRYSSFGTASRPRYCQRNRDSVPHKDKRVLFSPKRPRTTTLGLTYIVSSAVTEAVCSGGKRPERGALPSCYSIEACL